MTASAVPRRWLWRKPLMPPAWDALGEHRAVFHAADAAIAAGARRAAALADAGLNRRLPPPRDRLRGIHHPLAAKFAPVGTSIDLSRSQMERRAALAMADEAAGLPPLVPAAQLVRTAARHLVDNPAFRTRQIATDRDPMGRHIVFPGPEHIEPQLGRLDRFLAESVGAPSSFRAIVAAAMIVNCHALSDGNGRASRILFNLIAGPGAARDYYLPLYEIGVFSRGGYIIRLRQAELHADWGPLAEFTLAAASFWHRQMAIPADLPIPR
ncbi:Fic family protein [Sphingomonas sp. HT-1]|uniref:Fic family protein n=1 Tax=unclassified Sphingomonas TaxID=196159 RepID=UPI000474E2F7|nr:MULTISPECIES: Fic family protein [unclassified Sphingomonas]KTF67502.1 hypothetical protein ATB93_17330 [Sphingomonas sp. WG]